MSAVLMCVSTSMTQSATVQGRRKPIASARSRLLWLLAGVALTVLCSAPNTLGMMHASPAGGCRDATAGPQIHATCGVARF